jgi:transcriptional regulator with XRE-family HTH domain
MTDIGKRIKELRTERDLTIEMVVADMNRKFNFDPPYHKSMISRWENQKSEPTLENAKYLSLYFDVSLDYLIGVTNTRTPLRLREKH